jgi:hypothetical protein
VKRTFSTLLVGAALVSMFAPRKRAPAKAPAQPPSRPEPAPQRRLYALVQTRPEVLVLAVSAHADELCKEMQELNETWNHRDLRDERHVYAIQAAPVLHRTIPVPPQPARSRTVAVRGA